VPVTDRSRSLLATVVGWVLVAALVWFGLRFVLGTVFWILRSILVILVILGLAWAYLALKAPSDHGRRPR
jgi:hypothetical protein